MNEAREKPKPAQPAARQPEREAPDQAGLQPPATGGNTQGSPEAAVMKQFAKTKTESSGGPS